jgi:hypothetical protein
MSIGNLDFEIVSGLGIRISLLKTLYIRSVEK